MAVRRTGTGRLVWAIVAIVVVFVALQVWAAYETSRRAERILQEAVADETLETETARQEYVKLRLETERDALFLRTVLTSLIPLATVVSRPSARSRRSAAISRGGRMGADLFLEVARAPRSAAISPPRTSAS